MYASIKEWIQEMKLNEIEWGKERKKEWKKSNVRKKWNKE